MSDRAAPRAWIGIDLGTQSVRVVAIADDGATLAEAARPLDSHRDALRHEQDPEQWWTTTAEALREVTAALDGRRVAALAISATSGTILVVDETGRPSTAGLMYDDARATALVDRVNEAGSGVWDRLGYRMQGTWALPKMLWLHQHGLVPPGSTIAHQPDVITARLTGHRVPSDTSHALKAGVDLDLGDWPADVMATLGLPRAVLPDVVAPGSILGRVSPAAAELTGLPIDTPVVAGMTDGCAAQLAAGAVVPGAWNSVLGTTLVIKGMSRDRHPDPTGAVYAHRAPFGEGWMPGGASSTGAGSVSEWLPGRDLSRLTTAAQASTAIPVAYPLVGRGERFPFVEARAEAFFGDAEAPPTDDAALLSALAHGVAYVERLSFDLLSMCGYAVDGSLSFTGGGARNAWWNQLRADVLQRDVLVPDRGEGAVGMAVLAAAAMDDTTPAAERLAVAASRLLPAAASLSPDLGRARALFGGYRGFLDGVHKRGWLPEPLYVHAGQRLR